MVTRSSGSPSRWSTVTVVAGSRCSSSASFTSESTKVLSHCAMSSGPDELGVVDGAAVDHARVARHRVDADARPREVGERQAGEHADLDLVARGGLVQQHDRALGDRRVPGHRVDDGVAARGRGEQCTHDLGVRRVEVLGAVIGRVECLEHDPLGGELLDRGVARRAHEPSRRRGDRRRARRGGDDRPPPDRDPRSRRGQSWARYPPADASAAAGQPVTGHTWERAGTQRPYFGSTLIANVRKTFASAALAPSSPSLSTMS